MTLVIDSGVASKWFFLESDSDAARALFDAGTILVAPDLIVPESCNIALKKLRLGQASLQQVTELSRELPRMFHQLVPTAAYGERALEMARVLGHPAYDCFYLALAEQLGFMLITADRRLSAAVSHSEWGDKVRMLTG